MKNIRLTVKCGPSYLLSSIQVSSPPVFCGKPGPNPDLALSILQQLKEIIWIGVEAVKFNSDDFLSSKFDVDSAPRWRRRSGAVHGGSEAMLSLQPIVWGEPASKLFKRREAAR